MFIQLSYSCFLEYLDVLLVAEYFMDNYVLPGAHLHVVQKGSGFKDLSMQIRSGKLILSSFKIIILLIGGADVVDREVQIIILYGSLEVWCLFV